MPITAKETALLAPTAEMPAEAPVPSAPTDTDPVFRIAALFVAVWVITGTLTLAGIIVPIDATDTAFDAPTAVIEAEAPVPVTAPAVIVPLAVIELVAVFRLVCVIAPISATILLPVIWLTETPALAPRAEIPADAATPVMSPTAMLPDTVTGVAVLVAV